MTRRFTNNTENKHQLQLTHLFSIFQSLNPKLPLTISFLPNGVDTNTRIETERNSVSLDRKRPLNSGNDDETDKQTV